MINIEQLKAERLEHVKEMRALQETAEKRSDKKYTEDEANRWTELSAKVDSLRTEIERNEKMEELAAEEARAAKPKKKEETADERRTTPLGEDILAIFEKRVITGMSELVPADGGFFVNTDQAAGLAKTTFEQTSLASKCRNIPISANSNSVTMNAVAETSRVTGNRWGGVIARWLEEAGLKEAAAPKFRQITLKLKKLAALCYLTDELLQDASALQAIVTQAFTEEFAWLLDDAVLNGVGGGQPIGIMGHASLVTVAAQPGQLANTIVYENIVDMFSRLIASSMPRSEWYINQDILPQLYTMALAVGFGGVPVYLPAGGASVSPYGTLMGRPVNAIEQAATLGTTGDIAFLDLSQYQLAQKAGIDQASSIHVRFLNDETVLRFVMRVDGQPLWNTVMTPATGSANTLSPFVVMATRA
jgi:HK97 family phage major capsid protein